ncbi:hypothetical protein ES703_92425 [subsurface metagenome]
MDKILEPETFWQEYSSQLNQAGNWGAYQNNTDWTKAVIGIAKKTCECKKFKLKTQTEYYKIDLIGYRREEPNVDCNWWLDVAYEHENDDTWYGELCKLCYVAADLRVVSSYHDFSKEPIEKKLKDYLDWLGKEKILRVPDGKWLFVFGPRLVCAKQPFRAFTIDEKLTVIPISGGEEVVPQRWKQNA